MKRSISGVAFASTLVFGLPVLGEVMTYTSSFQGDLCATDVDGTGDFDDCATIAGNAGTPGIYILTVSDLDPEPLGDVTVRIMSSDADLYAGPAENNSDERFRLLIEGMNFGLLFDSTANDEALASEGLAASVRQSIFYATGSAAPMNLQVTLPFERIAPYLADGELDVQFDFREDLNINRFTDPTVTVSYEVAGDDPPVRLSWQPANGGFVPENAVEAGFEGSGEILYICRAEWNNGLHPGKVRRGFDGCNIGYGGSEIAIRSYEVLVR